MARKSEIGYWHSRGCYGTTIQGQQHQLAKGPDDQPDGPTYLEALARFKQLMGGSALAHTVSACIEGYKEWMKSEVQPETLRLRAERLEPVATAFGQRYASSLIVHEIQKWAQERRKDDGWSNTTVRMTLAALKGCLNWAVEDMRIERNPLAKLKLPGEESRGLEYVLDDHQVEEVLRVCKGAFYDLVRVLLDTGARPGELIAAEKHHFDEHLNALVYQANARPGQKRHKTAGTGRARVIYLAGEALDIVQRLIREHPSGPLFRSGPRRCSGPGNGQRKPWTQNVYRTAFGRLRRKLGIPRLIAYSLRHTYAVRWLRAGESIDALAEVLGTSVRMIRKNYGHLADQHDYLRRIVEKLARPRSNG